MYTYLLGKPRPTQQWNVSYATNNSHCLQRLTVDNLPVTILLHKINEGNNWSCDL